MSSSAYTMRVKNNDLQVEYSLEINTGTVFIPTSSDQAQHVYQIEDSSGQAPAGLTLSRTGSDLHIIEVGNSAPLAVVQDFYHIPAVLMVPESAQTSTLVETSALQVDAAPVMIQQMLQEAGAYNNDGTLLLTTQLPGDDIGFNISGLTDDSGIHQGAIQDGGITDDLTPTLQGNLPGGYGLVVTIYANNEQIGTAQVDQQGHWTFTAPELQGNTQYTFQAELQDPLSDAAYITETFTVTTGIDYTVPTITNVSDDAGDVTGDVTNGGATDDSSPTLSGTADAGVVVNVYDGKTLLGSTVVDNGGKWTFTPSAPLAPGNHNFSATATNGSAETSHSGDYDLMIQENTPPDVAAPAAPVISGVLDDIGSITGNVVSGGYTDDKQPQLSGTAEAGSIVNITVYSAADQQSYLLGSVTADSSGNWVFPLVGGETLLEGNNIFNATATDAAGNVSGSSASYNVILDSAIAAPVITGIMDNVGTVMGNVESGAHTDDRLPVLTGTAEAGSTVRIVVFSAADQQNHFLGTVTADRNGNWSFTVSADMYALPRGNNTFRATATDSAGNVSDNSDNYNVILDAPVARPVITGVVDNVGTVTGNVEIGGYTNDKQPTITGTAEAGSTVEITTWNGSRTLVLGSVVTDSSGHWSYTLSGSQTLVAGNNNISATARIGSDVSNSSSNYHVSLDTAIAAPVITGVQDNVGADKGNVAEGAHTDDKQPVLTGTAEAGSTVRLVMHSAGNDQSYILGTVTADSTGHWSYTISSGSVSLQTGRNTFWASATDVAGNASGNSDSYSVLVDGFVARPVITGVWDNVGTVTGNVEIGGYTDDKQPGITGTAEAGSIVEITTWNGSRTLVLGSVVADSSGNWTYRLSGSQTLVAGNNNISATARIGSDVSGSSSNYHVSLDTAIAAPVITGVQDNVGADKGNVANGGHTDDRAPVLTGTAEAGSNVRIVMYSAADQQNHVLGTVTADSTGHWSFTLSVGSDGLQSGLNRFRVSATDAAGNVSDSSGNYVVYLDTAQTQAHAAQLEEVPELNGMASEHASDVSPLTINFDTLIHQQQAQGHQTSSQAVVDMHAANQGTLTLSLNDVLTHAEQNLFIHDGKSQMSILGENGGHVELKGVSESSLNHEGSVTSGGVTYDVYSVGNNNAELLVQHGLEIHTAS